VDPTGDAPVIGRRVLDCVFDCALKSVFEGFLQAEIMLVMT